MPDPTTEELLRLARLWISEGDAERLVAWIAARTGNRAPLGGDPLDRLTHALEDWLDAQQRLQLLRWLADRLPKGLSPVPG